MEKSADVVIATGVMNTTVPLAFDDPQLSGFASGPLVGIAALRAVSECGETASVAGALVTGGWVGLTPYRDMLCRPSFFSRGSGG